MTPPSGHTAPRAPLATPREKLITRTDGILRPLQPVPPTASNQEVFALFESKPDIIGLPVVEDGVPIGLINRNIFMQSLARPFHREVYLHKSCIAFMDKQPLIVDRRLSIQDLSFRVLAMGDKAFADGFIITDEERYAGVGIAQDMLKAVATLQAEKNRQVMESIDYASVIQKSLSRPSRETMRATLPDHFLIWEPRDVVSGDFYHFQHYPDGFLLILFDCTGHGVPGAFMTLIMSAFLQGALNEHERTDPAGLLAAVNRKVKVAMAQVDHSHCAADDEAGDAASDDGMDAAVCWIDPQARRVTYAGAHLPLLIKSPQSGNVEIVDGDRAGVGYAATPMDQQWHNHVVDLPEGSGIYLFTDGFFDQLGGEKRIAFGKRRVQELIAGVAGLPMPEQRHALLAALADYQGSEARRDDVSAIGVRL